MNVFAYRLPSSSSYKIVEGGSPQNSLPAVDGRDYFLVHPFHPNSKIKVFPVNKEINCIPESIVRENAGVLECSELTPIQYKDYILDIQSEIKRETVNKVVASRRKLIDVHMSPQVLFNELCSAYPDSFVFFISTPEFGSWIGASPELLLRKEGNQISTMALAGTRPIGTQGEWDQKNIMEQSVVTSFLKNVFFINGFACKEAETVTLKAGPVEHIMTPISAEITPSSSLEYLLSQISPTPALSGYPMMESVNIITRNEQYPRELYGGYMGPWNANGNFRLNVILRCAKLWQDFALLFAGGGITELSDFEDEWVETERKLSTLHMILR